MAFYEQSKTEQKSSTLKVAQKAIVGTQFLAFIYLEFFEGYTHYLQLNFCHITVIGGVYRENLGALTIWYLLSIQVGGFFKLIESILQEKNPYFTVFEYSILLIKGKV